MTAPTADELRAELARGLETALDTAASDLMGISAGLHDFYDMRQSEIDRLDGIVEEELVDVAELMGRVRKAAIEAAIRAETRFWSEYPNAPRATQEPVPA